MGRISVAKQKELLREHRSERGGALATNSYNLCQVFNPAEAKVCITYRPGDTGRAYQAACWQVVGIDFKTNPAEHWMQHGHKSFIAYTRHDKEPQRIAAFEWATQQGYGDEWVRDVFGGYQTRETIEKYNAWLAEQVAL